MSIIAGIIVGFVGWFIFRYVLAGIYTVNQERARGEDEFRARGTRRRRDDAGRSDFRASQTRGARPLQYPQVRVIPPGGPYFKWPWEKVYKVHVSTQTMNMALRPRDADGQPERHGAGSGDQRPVEHRLERPDPLSRLGEESLCLSLRRETAHRPRDGLLHFGAARAHREFRSAAAATQA